MATSPGDEGRRIVPPSSHFISTLFTRICCQVLVSSSKTSSEHPAHFFAASTFGFRASLLRLKYFLSDCRTLREWASCLFWTASSSCVGGLRGVWDATLDRRLLRVPVSSAKPCVERTPLFTHETTRRVASRAATTTASRRCGLMKTPSSQSSS